LSTSKQDGVEVALPLDHELTSPRRRRTPAGSSEHAGQGSLSSVRSAGADHPSRASAATRISRALACRRERAESVLGAEAEAADECTRSGPGPRIEQATISPNGGARCERGAAEDGHLPEQELRCALPKKINRAPS